MAKITLSPEDLEVGTLHAIEISVEGNMEMQEFCSAFFKAGQVHSWNDSLNAGLGFYANGKVDIKEG